MSFDYLLRVPIIFFMDELFKSSFELSEFASIMFPVNSTFDQIEIEDSTHYFKIFIKIIVSCLMFCSSLCLLILPAKYLFPVYFQVASVCVVFFSYWKNIQMLGILSREYKNFKIDMANELITWNADGYIIIFIQSYPRFYKLLCSLILQYCLSQIFDVLQVLTTSHSTHKVFKYSFIIPTIIVSILNTSGILNTVIIFSTLLQSFILLKTLFLNIFTITNLIQSGYNHILRIIDAFGIFPVVESQLYHLKIPSALRVFWAIRVLIKVLDLATTTEIKKFTLFEAVKYLLIKGCDTCTAVLGMTSFVSYFCDIIGKSFHWVLLINEVNDINCGKLTTIIFILQTMQSGLTGLDPENRWIQLCQHVHVVCINLQDYIYNMVKKSLIYFSDSHNRSLNRHSRALLVCGFLIMFAVTTLYFLLPFYHSVPWLLVAFFLNIICILKILVLLAVYLLLSIDSDYSTCWENIDDYLYYTKSFGYILEFWFQVIFFMYEIYYLVFISGGVIHTSIICIKVYLNMRIIWKEWKMLIQHRIDEKKIQSLTDASSIQLLEFNDVCAICDQKMKSGIKTKCNHYFYGKLLRNWT